MNYAWVKDAEQPTAWDFYVENAIVGRVWEKDDWYLFWVAVPISQRTYAPGDDRLSRGQFGGHSRDFSLAVRAVESIWQEPIEPPRLGTR